MNAPVGIAGTPQTGIPADTPVGSNQYPVTGAVQQQAVQRPVTGAASVQRDIPVSQGTPQIQPPVSVPQPSATGNQAPVETTPPPHVQSIDELKDALIQHLLIEHTMLSAAVGKTLNWSERDGILYMSVHTPFEVQQLQREKNILTQKTAELYGKELKIQIMLAQEETVQKLAVPARVEMVRRNIKGSIVDIQKKAVAEEPEEE